MKKILIFILIATLITGCTYENFKKDADQLVEDGKTSINNVIDEVEDVKDTITETKDKIDETVEDVENAINAINNAKDAISELAE